MSLNLSDDEIHGLIAYARDKFAAEQYPFAPPAAADPGSARQARPEAGSSAARAEEAVCAEPNAAKEEQAQPLTPG